MTPTILQIGFAVFALTVIVAIFVIIRKSEVAASARRRMAMMMRAGLKPEIFALLDPRTSSMMEQARRRCRKCPREDYCERWLAGDVEGPNVFCPNAPVFSHLKGAGA